MQIGGFCRCPGQQTNNYSAIDINIKNLLGTKVGGGNMMMMMMMMVATWWLYDQIKKIQGPRDLDKYKSSEWLRKLVSHCLNFGFCERCPKCWNLQIETKKISAFIARLLWILFLLNIFSTLLTLLCINGLLHIKNHTD